MISVLTKRRGAMLAGIFSVALGSLVLLCGAGSVPIENLLPQGAMQGDLNAGGHNVTNAATVYATAVYATNVVVSGSLTAPAGFALPFSQLSGTPTTLSGYGITDPIVLTSGSYANPAWLTSVAYSKLSGAPTIPPAITLTTTGTSGAASYNSGTGALNVPQYAGDDVQRGHRADADRVDVERDGEHVCAVGGLDVGHDVGDDHDGDVEWGGDREFVSGQQRDDAEHA